MTIDIETNHVQVICHRCDRAFRTEVIRRGDFALPASCHCERCFPLAMEAHKAEELRRKRAEAASLYQSRYPEAPTDTDIEKLRPEAKSKALRILEWRMGPRGLIVCGPSGFGKTRLVHLLIRRLFVEEGIEVMFYRAHRLTTEIEDSFDRPRAHSRLITAASTAPVLVIDDLGQEKCTERFGADLLAILEARTCAQRPTIITTNYPGDKLVRRFSESEKGEAIVRRLREFFDHVVIRANQGP